MATRRSSLPPAVATPYLRKLLVVGAHAVLFHQRPIKMGLEHGRLKLMETEPFKLVAVAMANKLARIAFAVGSARCLAFRKPRPSAQSSRTRMPCWQQLMATELALPPLVTQSSA